MYRSRSRVVRGMLCTMVIALAACAEEPTAFTPTQKLEPSFGLGDVIMVTNLSGGNDVGSLRWALSHVTDGEVIRFAPGLAGQTITLDTTIVVWGRPFTLEGPADGGITISGGGRVRVFDLDPGAAGNETVLRNLSIVGGKATSGAGVLVRSQNAVSLRVENSTLAGNVANVWPALSGLSTTLVNTTVSGNTVLLTGSPTAAVFSNVLALVNSTIAHNASIGVSSVNLTVRNSIISNHDDYSNCTSSAFQVEGHNISDDDSCGSASGITIADPMLGPLADNGGPTPTHALLTGSPAIDAGFSCSVTVDQRYAPRDAKCDSGAFEFLDPATVLLTMSSSGTFDANGWATLSGTVQCSRNETFDLHIELHQIPKKGRDAVDLRAFTTLPVVCTTTVQSWSAALGTTDGPFENGEAVARAATLNAATSVTPASVLQSVKLFKSRK